MCTEGFRDDSERDDVFAPTPSPLSVRGLLLCAEHGSIFEWKLETLCVLSCKQTHPVKEVFV